MRVPLCLALIGGGIGAWAQNPCGNSGGNPASGGPQINPGGIVNAASYAPKLVRGGLAIIFGSNLSSGTDQASAPPWPVMLAGASVTVGGVPAPLYFVNAGQVNFQVPFEVASDSMAAVIVSFNGAAAPCANVAMADYGVGVFTYPRTASAQDPIVVHGADNSLVTPASPALPNEVLVVYATGIGKLTNAPMTGQGAPSMPPAAAVDTPAITVGGSPAQVSFAGLTPGSVGLAQFNIQLPASLPSGNLPLVIQFPGDSSVPVNLAVSGNITGSPSLRLSTNALAFGTVTAGQTEDLAVTVSNTGSAPLSVSGLSVTGAGFSIVSPAVPFNVAPGAAQAVTVRFAPGSGGAANGTLSIASNDAASPASVTLSGTGVAPAISVSPATLTFGTVILGQTQDLTVTINNTGQAPLTVNSLTGSANFSVVSPTAPFNVGAGSFAVATVRFAPTSLGAAAGTLTITSNDSSKASVTVALSGTGAAPTPLACGFMLGPGIYAKWTALGGQNGVLGCPTADETEAPKTPSGTTGRRAVFANGVVYWHRDGFFAGQAYEIHGCPMSTYTAAGGSAGFLGFPVSDQYTVPGGSRDDFQGGYILVIRGTLACPALKQGADFSGSWLTTRGTLTLAEDSIDVTGNYGSGTSISGQVFANSAGIVLSATYQDPDGRIGMANFTLAPDGNSFRGTYQPQSGGTNSWTGTRYTGGSAEWFTPARLDFGTVAVGQSRDLVIAVSDLGLAPLVVTSFASDKPAFKVTTGAFTVQPGTTFPLPIRFSPAAAGPASGTITVTTTDPGRPTIAIHVVGSGQ